MSLLSAPSNRYYEPLLHTLDKSRVRAQRGQITNNNLTPIGAQSRVSVRMKSLSPHQADRIRRETIIPYDKQLVPTNNLWKIRGKQFTAVDVSVREGAPVPPNIIRSKSHKGPVVQQTLYQFRKNSNVPHFGYPQTTSIGTSRIISPKQNISQSRKVASPIRISTTPSYSFLNRPHPIQSSRLSTHNNLTSVDQYYTSSNTNTLQQTINSQQNKKLPRQPISLLNNQKQKNQKKYKYNLFSSFDQLLNTGCKSCGANQIIAKKPEYTEW